jgi:DNA-binding transcriptional ArsR family regulator
LERRHDLAVRTAEGEGDDRGPLAREELELRFPAVVVPARLAELHAVPLRLAGERGCVGLDRGLVHREPCRDEDVDPERPRGRRPNLGQLALELRDRLVTGGEESETASLGDSRRERRRRRPSAHRCADDRDLEQRAELHPTTIRPVIVNSMVQYYPAVDRAFTALADPTRRAVLERLGSGSATISELAEPFGMSLTGMRKHVRLLEEAELVTTEKIGRVRRCMLVPYAFEGISTWLQRLDRFAQVVERTKGA